MKRLLTLFLIVIMLFSISACDDDDDENSEKTSDSAEEYAPAGTEIKREDSKPLFDFVVYGDSRNSMYYHCKVVEEIKNMDPDFIIHTGDFVGSSDSDLDWYMFNYCAKDIKDKIYPVMGNHDDDDNMERIWKEFPSFKDKDYYSFIKKNTYFLIMNSEDKSFRENSEQYNWIKEDLKKSSSALKLFFMHRPLYGTGNHNGFEPMRKHLEPMFEENKVQIVFSGHNHLYERSVPILYDQENYNKGVVHITVGNAGATLHNCGDDPLFKVCKSEYGFVFADVYENRIHLRAFDYAGDLFDEFTLFFKK